MCNSVDSREKVRMDGIQEDITERVKKEKEGDDRLEGRRQEGMEKRGKKGEREKRARKGEKRKDGRR